MLESQKFSLPSIIEKTSQEFLNELEEFYAENRCHPGPFPRIFGELLDLKSLYLKVQNYGGSNRVTYSNKWNEIALSFGVKFNTLNISNAFKDIYQRFLDTYERHQKLDYNQNASSDSFSTSKSTSNIPSSRSKFLRTYLIDELLEIEKQLLSGLDNETDFALNSLLILSASTKSFSLSINSRLPIILLELTGACQLNSCHERILGLEKNFTSFWQKILTPEGFRLMYNSEKRNSDQKYFHNVSFRNYDIFEQRLNQILTIFRNSIITESNFDRIELGRCSCLINFIVTACYSVKEDISNLAMETITNLNIPLENERLQCIYMNLIENAITSANRSQIKYALQLISNLSQGPLNIRHTSFSCIYTHMIDRNQEFYSRLITSDRILQSIVYCLCLEDINLLVNSLNAIFSITTKGRAACQKIINFDIWNHLKYLIFLKAQCLSKKMNKEVSVYQGACQNPVYKFPSYQFSSSSYRRQEDVSFQAGKYGNLMHAPMPSRPHIPVPVYDEKSVEGVVDTKQNFNEVHHRQLPNGFSSHQSQQAKPDLLFDANSPKDCPIKFAEYWIRRNYIPDPIAIYNSRQLHSELVIAHKANLPQIDCLTRLDFIRILKKLMINVDFDENAQFFHIKCIRQISPSTKDPSSPPILKNSFTNHQVIETTSPSSKRIKLSNDQPPIIMNGYSHRINKNPDNPQQLPIINGHSGSLPVTSSSTSIKNNHQHNSKGHAMPMKMSLVSCNGLDSSKSIKGDANNNNSETNYLSDNDRRQFQQQAGIMTMGYPCKWTDCHMRNGGKVLFHNANQLSSHVYNTHFLSVKDEKKLYCPWQGCADGSVERTPISLLSHLSDRHYRPETSSALIDQKTTTTTTTMNGLYATSDESLSQTSTSSFASTSSSIFATYYPHHNSENGKSFSPHDPTLINGHPYHLGNGHSNDLLLLTDEKSNIVTTKHVNRSISLPNDPNRKFFVNTTGREFSTPPDAIISPDSINDKNKTFANHYEGPITKHIRHVALLILRNLVQFCPQFVNSKVIMIEEILCSIISLQIDSIELASECLGLLYQKTSRIQNKH